MPDGDETSGSDNSNVPTCPRCSSTQVLPVPRSAVSTESSAATEVTPVPAPTGTTVSTAPPRMDIITQLMVDAIPSTSSPDQPPTSQAKNDSANGEAPKDS